MNTDLKVDVRAKRVRVVAVLKAMVRATVPKIAPVPVPANVIAKLADLLPAAVAVEKHKAVALKVADQVAPAHPVVEAPAVADKVLPDAVPVDKAAGKAVLAAGNEAPVVKVADRP